MSNELGNRYALAALKDKRASLASEIMQTEGKLRYLKEAISHVDATLKLLDPSIEPNAIPNKRVLKRIMLFRSGELGRLILDTLRRGPEPGMKLHEVVSAIITAGGHSQEARKTVSMRVRSNLAYLVRNGKVRKTGERKDAVWTLL